MCDSNGLVRRLRNIYLDYGDLLARVLYAAVESERNNGKLTDAVREEIVKTQGLATDFANELGALIDERNGRRRDG